MSGDVRPAPSVVETLIREHDIIQRALHLLETAATMLDEGKPVPEDFSHWSVEFFGNFADHLHHAKEEGALFPALVKRCGASLESEIDRLVVEHGENRVCIAQLGELDLKDKKDCQQFAKLAHRFVECLRDHIFRENNSTFAAAQRILTEEEMQMLLVASEEAERTNGTQGYSELYVPMIEQWEARFSRIRKSTNA
jgi:hemerythrin-like domain-containing protein